MKSRILAIASVIALIAIMVPGVAYAATTGAADGTFTLANVAPSVGSVSLLNASLGAATAMDPQVEFVVRVGVTDDNQLLDLSTVTVTVFYDANGNDAAGDTAERTAAAQTAGVMTWTNGTPSTWTISAGSPTTWSIISGSCVEPTLTNTTGNFDFHFKSGMVATEALDWDMYVSVDDGTASPVTAYDAGDYDMNWYGAITVNTATVSFGTPGLGTGFANDVNEASSRSVTVISNGPYDIQVKSAPTWSGGGYTATLDTTPADPDTAAANEFALKAWKTDLIGSALVVDTTGVTIDDTGTLTGESGSLLNTITMWLKIASAFNAAAYSGTITFTVSNGS